MTERTTPLDEASILAEAREKAQLEDFGDENFREPLSRLLESLDREGQLTETGRAMQRARIVGSLVTRLSAEAYFQRHPEILEEDLGAPVVVVGPIRSGTTRLHRLMSKDARHFAVRWWENRSPAPYPGSDWRREDPRIPDAHEEVRAVLAAMPQLAAMHPWDAEGPDEEIMLLEHAFLSHVPESAARVPSYRSWLDAQDLTPGYEYMVKMLRFLQWQKKQRGETGDRWVLKAPMHLSYLDTLFQVLPGTRILKTHRDPLTTVPSAASLYSTLWEMASDRVDRTEVGRQVGERLARAMHLCMETRDRSPADRFCDVWYADVQSDPLAEVERIYGWLGAELTGRTRHAIEAWLKDNARDKRPPHRYTLEEFGYTEAGLASDFAEYRERYILPRST